VTWFLVHEDLLVGRCMQDCKGLCAEAMIYATRVDPKKFVQFDQ